MKTIYILHGWTTAPERWDNFIRCLAESGFETRLLRIPGLTEKTDHVWTLDDYVNWLKEILDEESEKPILLGHSNGGRIALAYAAKYPQTLRLLVLIDSAGIYHNQLPIRLKRYMFRTIAKLGKKFTTSEMLRSLLYKMAQERDYRAASPVLRETMQKLISVDLTPRLGDINTSTVIIWGSGDTITPLSDGKLMRRCIPNAKLVIIEGAGHSPQYTHSAQVCRSIAAETATI